MSCPEFEALSAYADGESLAGEREGLEAHLSACPGCRELLRGLEAEKACLLGLPLPPVPEELLASLDSMALARAPGRRDIFGRFLSELRAGLRHPAAVLALAAAACVALLLWGRQRGLLLPGPELPVDVLTAAHGQYELTLPLAPSERILSEMPRQLAVGWPVRDSGREEANGVY